MMWTVGGVDVGERRAVRRPAYMLDVMRDSSDCGEGTERAMVRFA